MAGRSNAAASLAGVAMGLLVCVALAGCFGSDNRKPIFSTTADHHGDQTSQDIQTEISLLASGKLAAKDADASKTYDETKNKLINRGAAIEPQLFEALAGNQDWAVRLGCIEVLEAVGTRHAIEPLIAALDDPDPFVALYANELLAELCKHREIPEHGLPSGANGLPGLPKHAPSDVAIDSDEQAWIDWHRQHHVELHKAWETWWAANKDKLKVD